MRTAVLFLIALFGTQASANTGPEEDQLPISDTTDFITRASACHVLAGELTLKTETTFTDLTDTLFNALDNAGWSSQEVSTALFRSQYSLPEVPLKPEETQSDYRYRLYQSIFRCDAIAQSGTKEIEAAIPRKIVVGE